MNGKAITPLKSLPCPRHKGGRVHTVPKDGNLPRLFEPKNTCKPHFSKCQNTCLHYFRKRYKVTIRTQTRCGSVCDFKK